MQMGMQRPDIYTQLLLEVLMDLHSQVLSTPIRERYFFQYFPDISKLVTYNASNGVYSLVSGIGSHIAQALLQGSPANVIIDDLSRKAPVDLEKEFIESNVIRTFNWLLSGIPPNPSVNMFDQDQTKPILKIEDNTTWSEIIRLYMSLHIPFSAMIEVTSRCNYKCKHCYLQGSSLRTEPDLSDSELLGAIDALHGMNCFALTFSGGEPFCRPGFAHILRHAVGLGFCTTVFTNGSLLTHSLIESLEDTGVNGLEISVLGHSESTYRKICGQDGLRHILELLPALSESSMNVRLKTPVLAANFGEIPEILNICREYHIQFSYDIMQFRSSYYSDLQENVFCDLEDIVWLLDEIGAGDAEIETKTSSHSVINCNSGAYSFTLDPKGYIFPCCSLRYGNLNIRETTLEEAWQSNKLRAHHNIHCKDLIECRDCPAKPTCQMCPGKALTANGSLVKPDKYICAIRQYLAKENHD